MNWQELLSHPALQSSIVPFAVGLVLAGLLMPVRLSGVGAAGGWLAAVYVIGNFALEPLTATRKLVIIGAVAALIGVVVDLTFKPTRSPGMLFAAIFAAGSVWVFWTVLSQQPVLRAAVSGAGCALIVLWMTVTMTALQADAVRAAAAGLGLGIGVGTGAVLGASALLGQYGLALGAASGSVLLLAIAMSKRVRAGSSLALASAVVAAHLAAGAVLLAQLTWWSVAALAFVPLAVRLPVPAMAPVWAQGVVITLYSLLAAMSACAIAYVVTRA